MNSASLIQKHKVIEDDLNFYYWDLDKRTVNFPLQAKKLQNK